MTPAEIIGSLDAQIADHGEAVKLRTGNSAVGEVATNAFVRGYRPDEIVGIIQQGDSKAILSPTGLGAVPVQNGYLVVGGTPRRIISVNIVRLAGSIVRHELQLRG